VLTGVAWYVLWPTKLQTSPVWLTVLVAIVVWLFLLALLNPSRLAWWVFVVLSVLGFIPEGGRTAAQTAFGLVESIVGLALLLTPSMRRYVFARDVSAER
jgi:hypothetical protein